jgi:hypothetical protein
VDAVGHVQRGAVAQQHLHNHRFAASNHGAAGFGPQAWQHGQPQRILPDLDLGKERAERGRFRSGIGGWKAAADIDHVHPHLLDGLCHGIKAAACTSLSSDSRTELHT